MRGRVSLRHGCGIQSNERAKQSCEDGFVAALDADVDANAGDAMLTQPGGPVATRVAASRAALTGKTAGGLNGGGEEREFAEIGGRQESDGADAGAG